MPYTEQELRAKIEPILFPLLAKLTDLADDGAVNYVITRIIDNRYFGSYTRGKDALGTLEAVKLEYYRRALVPYEDKKKELNGDVYIPWR